jgi:hypothetical protein
VKCVACHAHALYTHVLHAHGKPRDCIFNVVDGASDISCVYANFGIFYICLDEAPSFAMDILSRPEMHATPGMRASQFCFTYHGKDDMEPLLYWPLLDIRLRRIPP